MYCTTVPDTSACAVLRIGSLSSGSMRNTSEKFEMIQNLSLRTIKPPTTTAAAMLLSISSVMFFSQGKGAKSCASACPCDKIRNSKCLPPPLSDSVWILLPWDSFTGRKRGNHYLPPFGHPEENYLSDRAEGTNVQLGSKSQPGPGI